MGKGALSTWQPVCVHGCAAFPLGKETRCSFEQALHHPWRALGVTVSSKHNYNHPHLEPGTWLPTSNHGDNKRVDNFLKLLVFMVKFEFQNAVLMA